MQKILLVIVSIMLFTSCDDKNKSKKILLDSSGNINNVTVVIENEMWNGSLGETVRSILTTPIYGLPQDEPTFNLNHIPPAVFSGFVTINRTILKIEIGKEQQAMMGIAKNVYAQPQKVIVVSGKTQEDVINVLNSNSEKILQEFKNEEIKEQQRRINLSTHHTTSIKEKLGLDIKFQSAYRIAKETENFIWVRKDITTGTTNLMVYELPFNAIERNDSLVNQIIKIRDSIGKDYIRGRLDGEVSETGEKIESYMITENKYSPFVGETILDNKPTIETKGIWDLKGDFMSGPFINYAIEDKINNRWIIAEGFAFAPSVEKRNYMFELEAIIKSIKIN